MTSLSYVEWMTSSIPSLNPLLPGPSLQTVVFLQAFDVLNVVPGTASHYSEADLFITQNAGPGLSTFSFIGRAVLIPNAFVSSGASASLQLTEFQGRAREFRFPGGSPRDVNVSMTATANWAGLGSRELLLENVRAVILVPQTALIVVRQDAVTLVSNATVTGAVRFGDFQINLESSGSTMGVISHVEQGAMFLTVLLAGSSRRDWIPA